MCTCSAALLLYWCRTPHNTIFLATRPALACLAYLPAEGTHRLEVGDIVEFEVVGGHPGHGHHGGHGSHRKSAADVSFIAKVCGPPVCMLMAGLGLGCMSLLC